MCESTVDDGRTQFRQLRNKDAMPTTASPTGSHSGEADSVDLPCASSSYNVIAVSSSPVVHGVDVLKHVQIDRIHDVDGVVPRRRSAGKIYVEDMSICSAPPSAPKAAIMCPHRATQLEPHGIRSYSYRNVLSVSF